MYIPRRHRRKLFFPAGLLALAWLLWLGCGLITAQPRLRIQSVMEVLMPAPIHPDIYDEEEQYALNNGLIMPAQPPSLYFWYTIHLTGNPWQDYLSSMNAHFIARQLQVNPSHKRGVRLVFGNSTKYRQFVSMLDMFGTENLNKYWLDARHGLMTLSGYAVPTKPGPPMFCGTSMNFLDAQQPARLQNQLYNWQYSDLLLLLLPVFALRQLLLLRATFTRRS